MGYVTIEVEINHGKVSPKDPQVLPEKAIGLLTIFNETSLAQPRPIGLAKGEFKVPDDFNSPLAEDVLGLFEGQ